MPYFPLFIDLKGRPVLIVGGGSVAARKAEKLRPYGPAVTVVAPEIEPGFEGCTVLQRRFSPTDLDGMALVIAATDDAALNRLVSRFCRERNIPVNVVDCKQECTFLFPALVQQGELSVGISTGGCSPSAAVWLQEQTQALLPERMDEILDWLAAMRPVLKERFPDAGDRACANAALFYECLHLERIPEPDEVEDALREEGL